MTPATYAPEMSDLCIPQSQHDRDESNQTLVNGQTGLIPQFMLFGDSITQDATLTVQARLQTLYIRQLDVVNRGFSGYNTTLALQSLPLFLPLSIPTPSPSQPSIYLLTIFFGANDACLPGQPQHVPLPLYAANLRRIAEYPVFQKHDTKIIFITPAPVNEWQLSKPLNRTAIRARTYANAVKEVAREMQLPCVDLWTAFITLAGYNALTDDEQDEAATHETTEQATISDTEETIDPAAALSVTREQEQNGQPALPGSLSAPANPILSTLLKDGLHLAPRGYEILLDELMVVIKRDMPAHAPEHLSWCFRNWREILNQPKHPPPAEAAFADKHELVPRPGVLRSVGKEDNEVKPPANGEEHSV